MAKLTEDGIREALHTELTAELSKGERLTALPHHVLPREKVHTPWVNIACTIVARNVDSAIRLGTKQEAKTSAQKAMQTLLQTSSFHPALETAILETIGRTMDTLDHE